MAKNRTEVADIDRSLYDFRYGEEGFERLDAGLTPDIVTEISQRTYDAVVEKFEAWKNGDAVADSAQTEA